MTGLPFVLTPLPGEPFGLWWHTLAVTLGVTRAELAQTVGLAPATAIGLEHAATIANTTGTTPDQVTAMFTALRPCPPEHVLRLWTPAATTGFCPDCLRAGNPTAPSWAVPAVFVCTIHHRLLTASCQSCRHRPASRMAPGSAAADVSVCVSCATPLTTDTDDREPVPAVAPRLAALLTRLRDPLLTEGDREQAADELTDLTLIALHLSQTDVQTQRSFHAQNPTLAHFVEAAQLLDPEPGPDRLAALVAERFRGPRAQAVPFSWRPASPRLTARIARGHDHELTPAERIRFATTLPQPTPQPRRGTDPAIERAELLPDQIWPAWAIRLADDDSIDGPVFRAAMAAALLLPHSDLEIGQIGALLPHRYQNAQITHQLRRLAATPHGDTALRIITELSLALDRNTVPIDYPRRRRIADENDLIDRPTWNTLCRAAGLRAGRGRRLDMARSYLYELITGCALATAPPHYRIAEGSPRAEYLEFTTVMTAGLADTLAAHAQGILAAAGVTGEPLSWQPPTDWVTVTDWPGADPDQTDPAPIHQAVFDRWEATTEHWAPTQDAADALGISLAHLRHVLRAHPITRTRYDTARRGTIIATPASDHGPGHRHDTERGVFHVDPAWLQTQYLTWRRTLTELAAEIGCNQPTLRAFAETHGIERRIGNAGSIPSGAINTHPSEMPELLRKALVGQRSRDRLERFLLMTEHQSLNQAAIAAGVLPNALTDQLKVLEKACGGNLFHRNPRPKPVGPLTPLGEELCRQALDYLSTMKHENP